MRLIDGKAIASKLLSQIKSEITVLGAKYQGKKPGLAVVRVGNKPESAKYVEMKKRAAEQVGILSVEMDLPEDCTQDNLIETVSELNARSDIDGILVQLPLPSQCDQKIVLEAIDIEKDVDGFHPTNVGRLTRMGEELRQHKKEFVPLESRNVACTPLGAIVLLEESGCNIAGKHAVIVGRSNIVGLPAALMLLHRNATVSICHSRTTNLKEECRKADILIAAIGKPEFVRGDWIKPGAFVIDVGINFVNDATKKDGIRMCGDVEFEQAAKVAGSITPVPGGVGPMTVAMLMLNTLNNFKYRVHAGKVEGLIRRKSADVEWKYQ